MRYGQLVIGLKAHGKSTYCKLMSKYAKSKGRQLKLVNLDPCSQILLYDDPIADIRDKIPMNDYLKAEKQFVPPGNGLTHIIKFLENNMEWLLGANSEEPQESDNDYFLFDLPGSEIYFPPATYQPLITLLLQQNFKLCVIFIRDSREATQGYPYIETCIAQHASYLVLNIPHVNLMMKFDKLNDEDRARLQHFLNTEPRYVLRFENAKRNREIAVLARQAALLMHGHELDPNRKRGFAMDIREETHFKAFLQLIDEILGYGSNNLSPVPAAN